MVSQIWANTDSGKGLLPDGTKPLPEPMLAYHPWHLVPFSRGQFPRKSILIILDMCLEMVDFLIGHYTYRIFPPAIDIIPTLLAVVYSNGKYTN